MQDDDGAVYLRNESARKYKLGNKCLEKQDRESLWSATEHFRIALFNLKCIKKAEFSGDDRKMLSDVLSALIKVINIFIQSEEPIQKIVDELGKFFALYVNCLERFNQEADVLPGLSELNCLALGELYRKIPAESKNEKNCVHVYIAILTLFHDEMAAEENFKSPSDERSVAKLFNLYERALVVYQKLQSKLATPEPETKRVKPEVVGKKETKSILKKSGERSPERKKVAFFGEPSAASKDVVVKLRLEAANVAVTSKVIVKGPGKK